LQVSPTGRPSAPVVVMIATPVGKLPRALRNSRTSNASDAPSPGAPDATVTVVSMVSDMAQAPGVGEFDRRAVATLLAVEDSMVIPM
jgi:hypothetical protein